MAPRTLTSWLTEHRPLTTYHRLRDQISVTYKPHPLIRTARLHHQQVYTYRLHQGKLHHILNTAEHEAYLPRYAADDCFPPAADLPEPLTVEQFRRDYGGVGTPRYRQTVREIDTRLHRCTALARP